MEARSEVRNALDDLFGIGKPTRLILGEHDRTIELDIELAHLAWQDAYFVTGLFEDLGRETRGAGFVVSGLAIFDRDAHGASRRKTLAVALVGPVFLEKRGVSWRNEADGEPRR